MTGGAAAGGGAGEVTFAADRNTIAWLCLDDLLGNGLSDRRNRPNGTGISLSLTNYIGLMRRLQLYDSTSI